MRPAKVQVLSDGADGSNIRRRVTYLASTLSAFLTSEQGLRESKNAKYIRFAAGESKEADEFLRQVSQLTLRKFKEQQGLALRGLDANDLKTVKVQSLVTEDDGKQSFTLFVSKWTKTHQLDPKKNKIKECSPSKILNYLNADYLVEVSIKAIDLEVGEDTTGQHTIFLKPYININDLTHLWDGKQKAIDPAEEEQARAALKADERLKAISQYLKKGGGKDDESDLEQPAKRAKASVST